MTKQVKQRLNHAQEVLTEHQFPWYDGYWLFSYVNVKTWMALHHPDRLENFMARFATLRTDPEFQTMEIRQLCSAEELDEIRTYIKEIGREKMEKHEFLDFGRLVVHDDPYFNAMQQKLVDRVSSWCGEEVECSYNFLSLYNGLGVLPPHLDAPMAKWTLDLCLDQSESWPIGLSKVLPWPENGVDINTNWQEELLKTTGFDYFELMPGKAILFSGSSQWHYRNRLAKQGGNPFCHLVFFHFIPKGSYRLVHPRFWAEEFGLPEIVNLIIDY